MKNQYIQNIYTFFKEKQIFIAYVLISLALISFIYCYFKNRDKIEVPYFTSIYSTVAINIETNRPLKNLLLLKTNDNDLSFLNPISRNKSKKAQVTSFTGNMPLYNVGIAFYTKDKKSVLSNISNLSIFIGKDYWSFDNKQTEKLKQERYINGNNDFT